MNTYFGARVARKLPRMMQIKGNQLFIYLYYLPEL